jgi:hypothetical protein
MTTTALTRAASVAGAIVILAIVIGCMSFSVGNGEVVREESTSEIVPVGYGPGDALFKQDGKIHVPPDCSLDVYYPLPYYSRPNLTIEGGEGHVKVLLQHRDHFRIHNDGLFERDIFWVALGTRLVSTPGAEVLTPVKSEQPAPLPRELPAEPIPVQ